MANSVHGGLSVAKAIFSGTTITGVTSLNSPVIKAYDTNGVKFQISNGTEVGDYSNAGGWTFPLNTTHTFGNTTTAASTYLDLKSEGSNRPYLRLYSGTKHLDISVGSSYDLQTSSAQAFNITQNGTVQFSISSVGSCTLGPDSGTSTIDHIANLYSGWFQVNRRDSGVIKIAMNDAGVNRGFIGADVSNIIKFIHNDASTVYGYCETSGRWEFGVVGGTQAHTFNGKLKITATGTAASSSTILQRNTSNELSETVITAGSNIIVTPGTGTITVALTGTPSFAGGSMTDNLNFATNKGIESTSATSTLNVGTGSYTAAINIGTGASTQIVNIGTGSGPTTINIGESGDTVNIKGTLTWVNTTDLQVTDKLIRINKDGAAASGDAAGIEVEENSTVTGFIKTGNSRSSWTFKAPASLGEIWLTPSNTSGGNLSLLSTATTAKTITFPDITDTVVTLTAGQTLSNKTLTTPTIGSFVNATHNHTDNANGGTLSGTHGISITGSSASCTGNAATVTNGVYTTGDQTIGGTKTFSSTISGSINGNSATVTNGVYTIGDQTIGGTKTFSNGILISAASNQLKLGSNLTITGSTAAARTYTIPDVAAAATFVMTEGSQSINGTKTFSSTISGNINGSSASCTGNAATATTAASCTGNAATVTNGVYTIGNQTIGGTKTFSSTISGNITNATTAASCTGNATTATNAQGSPFTITGVNADLNLYSTGGSRTYTLRSEQSSQSLQIFANDNTVNPSIEVLGLTAAAIGLNAESGGSVGYRFKSAHDLKWDILNESGADHSLDFRQNGDPGIIRLRLHRNGHTYMNAWTHLGESSMNQGLKVAIIQFNLDAGGNANVASPVPWENIASITGWLRRSSGSRYILGYNEGSLIYANVFYQNNIIYVRGSSAEFANQVNNVLVITYRDGAF